MMVKKYLLVTVFVGAAITSGAAIFPGGARGGEGQAVLDDGRTRGTRPPV